MPITSTILDTGTGLFGYGTLAAPFTTVGTIYDSWQPSTGAGGTLICQLSTPCQAVMKLSSTSPASVASVQAGPYIYNGHREPDAGELIVYQAADFWTERVIDASNMGSNWLLKIFFDVNNNDDTLYLEYLYFRPLPKYFWNHASGQTMELPI